MVANAARDKRNLVMHSITVRPRTRVLVSLFSFSVPDEIAAVFFLAAWAAYNGFAERSSGGKRSLNVLMNAYRLRWMLEMQKREVRIFDSSLLNLLQTGTAFFASTSLLGLGATATLMRGTDDALRIFADLPFGILMTRVAWEAKCFGLTLIFGYAFFKFAWAYRLFNYVAILIGATPSSDSDQAEERLRCALRAGEMNIVAGRHFNRGQRAIFFAVAYLGWFVSPYVFMGTVSFTLAIMWLRQFASDARAAVTQEALRRPDPDRITEQEIMSRFSL